MTSSNTAAAVTAALANSAAFLTSRQQQGGPLGGRASAMAGGGKMTKARAGNEKTINELKESISKQQGFAPMLSYGIECFKKLGTSPVAIEEIIEMGGIDSIFAAVQQHIPHNRKVIESFMSMLKSFCVNDRLAKMIGDRIGKSWKWMTDIIKHHAEDGPLITLIAETVAKLAVDPTNTQGMARDGVFDALMMCADKHKGNPDVLAAIASALVPYSALSAVTAEKLLYSPCMGTLIAAMQSHPEHLPLCQNVANLLSNITSALGNDKRHMDELRRLGAVDALLSAVEHHPYDDKLLDFATGALKALTGASDVSVCLQVLVGNVALDGKFASALNKLAGLLLVPDNVDYLMKHGGVEWLVAVLSAANTQSVACGQTDPTLLKILQSGCLALKRCATDPNKVYEIMRHKGVPVLISIINDHVKQPEVLAAALGALGKLISDGKNKDNAKYIVKHNAIPAAIRAIQQNMGNPQVVRPALDLLNFLCDFDDDMFLDPLRLGGGIPLLTKIVEDYMDSNKPIATLALNALNKLIDNKKSNMKDLAGLPKMLMKILECPFDDENTLELCKAAMRVLDTLCENYKDAVPKLLSMGAVPCIQGVMNRFHDDEELCQIGRSVMPKLQGDEEQRRREEAMRLQREKDDRERLERKETEERLRLEAEMHEALEKMKYDEQKERQRKEREWAEEQRQRKLKEDEEKAKADAAKAAAAIKTINVSPLPSPKSPKIKMTKSAKAIFADDDRKKEAAQLSDETKQFLLAGQLLMKHSKSAAPRQRHIYLSNDLNHINWKDPKGDLKLKNRMKVYRLFGVVKGATTAQLMRKSLMGKPLAKDECAFSIFGADEDHGVERTVDLEAPTERERDRWVAAMEELIEWAKAKKLWGGDTMAVHEDKNKLYAKDKAAHVVL